MTDQPDSRDGTSSALAARADDDAEQAWLAARRRSLRRRSAGRMLVIAIAFGGGVLLNVGGHHAWLRVIQIVLAGSMTALMVGVSAVGYWRIRGNSSELLLARAAEERERHFLRVLDES